jgi:hypothetical protein
VRCDTLKLDGTATCGKGRTTGAHILLSPFTPIRAPASKHSELVAADFFAQAFISDPLRTLNEAQRQSGLPTPTALSALRLGPPRAGIAQREPRTTVATQKTSGHSPVDGARTTLRVRHRAARRAPQNPDDQSTSPLCRPIPAAPVSCRLARPAPSRPVGLRAKSRSSPPCL